ncbi:MAG: hypothetical protein IPP69_08430 [Flavobacteriales bacterium]|nr:hypothetical protein [Flavobacteriales bacterium]
MKRIVSQWAFLLVMSLLSSISNAQVSPLLGTCEITFNIGDDVSLCSSSSFYGLPAGSPAGGTYSGTGVLDDFFLANLAGPGEHIITYSYDNGVCIGTATDTITVVTPIPLLLDGDMELCFGESTVITALNGEDHEWESGSTGNSEMHQPEETTDYSVYGFDVNGCLTAAGYTIVVHPLPLVEILGDTSLCIGESSLLTASGAQTYEWSGGSTENTLLVDIVFDQQYALTGTDEFGCVNEDLTTVTVHEYPEVTATDLVYGCPGEEIFLEASGAETYQWSVGGDLSYVYVYPSESQMVTVIGTNEFGCSTEATSQIVVYDVPVFEITGDLEICTGEETALVATGDYSFVWSNGVFINTNMVSPESTSTYNAIAQNEFGCQSSLDVTVVVHQIPNVNVSGDAEICLGEVTTLSVTGAANYTWSEGTEGEVLNISPDVTNFYSVTGTDENGCETTIEFEITVHPLPAVEILGDEEVCMGEFGQYTVEGSVSQVWDNGAMGNAITRLVNSNLILSVIGTDENGCSASDEFAVTALSLPVLAVSGDMDLCEGESTVITASGAMDYVWSGDLTGEIFEVTPAATQDYLVEGTGENGCSTNSLFTIIVHETSPSTIVLESESGLCIGDFVTLDDPGFDVSTWYTLTGTIMADSLQWQVLSVEDFISVQSTDENGCLSELAGLNIDALSGPELTFSGDLDICSGESTQLVASGSDVLLWSTNENTEMIEVSPVETTLYWVSASNEACTSILEMTVTVHDDPTLTWSGDDEICEGASTTIELSGAFEYFLNDNSQDSELVLNPDTTTSYVVQGVSEYGCSSELILTITVDSLPNVQILGGYSPVCFNTELLLSATGAEDYVWNGQITGEDISIIPADGYVVELVGTDGNGCQNTTTFELEVTNEVIVGFSILILCAPPILPRR